jgi:phage pi2 protein 07
MERNKFNDMFYITGIRRGLGKALHDYYSPNVVDNIRHCDVFINCKYNGWEQVEMLTKAIGHGKRVISIGSLASDWVYNPDKVWNNYAFHKKALRDASNSYFDHGKDVSVVNFGYIDTESQYHHNSPKMSVKYAVDIVDWIYKQPHRVKEITVKPNGT